MVRFAVPPEGGRFGAGERCTTGCSPWPTLSKQMQQPSCEQKKAALIEEITRAFKDVTREDVVTLHEALAIDNHCGPEGRALARAQDTEAGWQEVPDEDIRATQFVLHFLDPKGFRHYLPAYLIWYLRNMDNEDPDFWSNTFGHVDFVLGAGYSGDIDDRYLSLFTVFTPEQSKAVAQFLAYQAEKEESAGGAVQRATTGRNLQRRHFKRRERCQAGIGKAILDRTRCARKPCKAGFRSLLGSILIDTKHRPELPLPLQQRFALLPPELLLLFRI